MLKPTTVSPPQTPSEIRVKQLEKEVLKYQSLCEHLGATVMYSRLSQEDFFTLWVEAEHYCPKPQEGYSHFFNRKSGMWELFELLEGE